MRVLTYGQIRQRPWRAIVVAMLCIAVSLGLGLAVWIFGPKVEDAFQRYRLIERLATHHLPETAIVYSEIEEHFALLEEGGYRTMSSKKLDAIAIDTPLTEKVERLTLETNLRRLGFLIPPEDGVLLFAHRLHSDQGTDKIVVVILRHYPMGLLGTADPVYGTPILHVLSIPISSDRDGFHGELHTLLAPRGWRWTFFAGQVDEDDKSMAAIPWRVGETTGQIQVQLHGDGSVHFTVTNAERLRYEEQFRPGRRRPGATAGQGDGWFIPNEEDFWRDYEAMIAEMEDTDPR